MNEVLVAAAIVIAGTLIAVRASMHSSASPGGGAGGAAPDDIVPDDAPLAFATAFEAKGPRVRTLRAIRLGAGLVLVGSAVGLLVIVIVRAVAILWPKIFPTTG